MSFREKPTRAMPTAAGYGFRVGSYIILFMLCHAWIGANIIYTAHKQFPYAKWRYDIKQSGIAWISRVVRVSPVVIRFSHGMAAKCMFPIFFSNAIALLIFNYFHACVAFLLQINYLCYHTHGIIIYMYVYIWYFIYILEFIWHIMLI